MTGTGPSSYSAYLPKKPKRSKQPLFIFLVLLVGTAAGAFWWLNRRALSPTETGGQLAAKVEVKQSVKEVTGNYLMNGTIFWGRGIEKWSQRANGTYDYARPFSGLHTFEPQKYDAWVADHECPILDIVIPFSTQVNNLVFNCRPEYLSEAAKYFQFMNLSNNHSYDQGKDGFIETRQRIIDAGVQPFGNHDPSVKEDICEVMALPVRLKKHGGGEEKATLPVAFCAWHYFQREPYEGEIEHMKQYAAIMPVFAFVHMGTEYLTKAAPIQQEIARRVIDAGAEFVIANNPHWVQNSEAYKGKLIVYSTGNFIFDQLDAEGMRSVSIGVQMTLPYNENTAKWLALGPECKALHDTCFDNAKQQQLTKLRPSFKFEAVAGDNSGKLTKKGNTSLQQAIEQRLNWQETLRQLGQ